ncbi:hypothetical protein L2E82_32548 [Cichorium intybus]|uniref:Uncharacterized protein n=1 Tax=Cichorium intybus TaxID=13427 RepID=A0ACB9BGM2_CICIN|nr:hypothetical protein L2E82_32548 [Cichorium intybus]
MATMVTNKQVQLKNYVDGFPKESDMVVSSDATINLELPKNEPGAILTKNMYLSCDPMMRNQMSKKYEGAYMESFTPGLFGVYPCSGLRVWHGNRHYGNATGLALPERIVSSFANCLHQFVPSNLCTLWIFVINNSVRDDSSVCAFSHLDFLIDPWISRLILDIFVKQYYAFEMEMTVKEDKQDSPMSGIYEIPGEPALVINGVPPVCSSVNGSLIPCDIGSDIDSKTNESFGDWLEGRKVQKLFGGIYYNGKVTKFDKESGWYRVVYEDGDFEDLEWHELQEVLQPLDITIPLKTLASKVNKKRQKSDKRFGKSVTKPS